MRRTQSKKQQYRASLQSPQPYAESGYGEPSPPAPRPRRGRAGRALLSAALVLAILITGAFAALRLLGEYLDPGIFGFLSRSEKYVPKNYGGELVHLLVVGIDYEEGRGYADDLGLTDMILYARFDLRDKSMRLLQIPRDSYVGEALPTGGTGKINALLALGPDRDNPINNLASEIERMFALPVDHYIAMDMDALKTIVDTLGGLKVYVPRDMSHAGSYLAQGWRWLDGAAAEFFVRNRYGAGFERADIDRLDNQRHFYSALFRRFLNLAPPDIVNLMPVFAYYCNTSFGVNDLIDLAYTMLGTGPENVTFCKAPGTTGYDPTGAGRSLYCIDLYGRGTEQDPGLAALLDGYFREEGQGVPPESLGLPQLQIPAGYSLYPPNVQTMGEVQQPEGGGEVDVEPHAE